MANNKKNKQAGAEEGAIVVGNPVSTSNVKFAPRKSRSTEYQPVLDAMAKMEKDQTLRLPTPSGLDADPAKAATLFLNRLNAAVRRFKPKAPKGCTFTKRLLAEHAGVGIVCEAE